tara:strand:+ start:734 stop:1375 length:642 start_codon:yes stop_codon:yes gene_type:complete
LSQLTGRLGLLSFAATVIALALLIGGVISRAGFDILFAYAFAIATAPFLHKTGLGNRASLGVLAALLIGIFIASTTLPNVRFAPYLAVFLINAVVAYVFLRNQLPGREPLILQLIGLIGMAPAGQPGFRRFIYWQCWAWVAFGATTSLLGLVAMFAPEIRPFAGTVIGGLVAAQLVWFFVSHGYANWRHKRPETWRDTVRAMSRPTVWHELKL